MGMCVSTLLANGLLQTVDTTSLGISLERLEKMVAPESYKPCQIQKILALKRSHLLRVTMEGTKETYSQIASHLWANKSLLFVDSLTPKAVVMTRGKYSAKNRAEIRLALMVVLCQQGMEKSLSAFPSLAAYLLQNQLNPEDLRALLDDWLPDDSYPLSQLRSDYELLVEATLEDLLHGLPWADIVLQENAALRLR